MCDLQRQFILCSCASPRAPKPLGALTWTLSRHDGYHEVSIEGILAFPDPEISDGLKSVWVESRLNAGHCFDFEYQPVELDELRIFAFPSSTLNRPFLSLMFRDGRWHRDKRHGFESSTRLIHKGNLEFAEKSRLNTLRSCIVKELEQISAPYSTEKSYLRLVLENIESWDADSLKQLSNQEAESLLEMIFQSALEQFGHHTKPEPRFLRRVDGLLLKSANDPQVLPTVPFRRPLKQSEWVDFWDKFEKNLGKRSRQFVFDDAWSERWTNQIATPETLVVQLHPLSHTASHLLSSSWIATMLDENTSYWTDPAFTWAVYRDEHGYYYTMGDI